jgi:hypothetical protein
MLPRPTPRPGAGGAAPSSATVPAASPALTTASEKPTSYKDVTRCGYNNFYRLRSEKEDPHAAR